MNISVPSTRSIIVGSVAHFLEPIILTNVLSYVGYSNDFIITEYGIINGYALALLLLPQFFTQSISTSLIPELAKYYAIRDIKKCKKRVRQIVSLSLLIGVTSTSLIFCIPEFFLYLIYNTTLGVTYIKILAPFLILFFINTPISNALQALDKSKEAMVITVITSVIRLSSLFILPFLRIGMYSLIIAIILSIVTTTYLETKCLKKALEE